MSDEGVFMKFINKNKPKGLVSIAMAITFVLISAVLMAISSSSTILGVKIINNNKYNVIAFDAAKAGLNYALADLNQNFYSYMSLPSINSTNTVSLGSSASFTLNYKNISSGNNSLLLVTSTGKELNSNVNKTMSQLFKFKSLIVNSPDLGAVTKGSIDLQLFSSINNTFSSDETMWSGGSISLGQSTTSTTNQDGTVTGGPSGGDISPYVVQSDISLNSLSDTEFIENFFGTDLAHIKQIATKYYHNTTNTNYTSVLNGVKGEIIYIEQNNSVAEIDNIVQLGTADEPIILIVEGQLKMSGVGTFNGLLFLTEKWVDKFDNSTLNGAVIVNGDIRLKGSATINYNPDIMNNISGKFGLYSKVPGSWKDF